MGIELLRRRSIPFLGFEFWGLKFMRARFAVSDCFRQLLSNLFTDMHNSNRQLRQDTSSGEILLEYKFYILWFVPTDVVRLKKECLV